MASGIGIFYATVGSTVLGGAFVTDGIDPTKSNLTGVGTRAIEFSGILTITSGMPAGEYTLANLPEGFQITGLNITPSADFVGNPNRINGIGGIFVGPPGVNTLNWITSFGWDQTSFPILLAALLSEWLYTETLNCGGQYQVFNSSYGSEPGGLTINWNDEGDLDPASGPATNLVASNEEWNSQDQLGSFTINWDNPAEPPAIIASIITISREGEADFTFIGPPTGPVTVTGIPAPNEELTVTIILVTANPGLAFSDPSSAILVILPEVIDMEMGGDGIGTQGLDLGGAPIIQLLEDASGIYTLVADQWHDKLYQRVGSTVTVVETKIPDPFFKTGYIGGN